MEWRGRLSSDVYIYDEDSLAHRRPYLGLLSDLVAWRGTRSQSISFHINARWTTDFADKRHGDPQVKVFDGYVNLSGFPCGSRLVVGRQFVYSGAGSALLDGAHLGLSPRPSMQLDLFAGSSVLAGDPKRVRSFTNAGVLGARLGIGRQNSTSLAVNWLLRRADGSLASHRIGLDGESQFGRFGLFARSNYDLLGNRLAGLLARATCRPEMWFMSAEFEWRDPSIRHSSVFSLIDYSRFRNLRFDLERRFRSGWALQSQLDLSMFTNGNIWRASLGLRSGGWTVAWVHQDGSDGDNDGIRGNATVRLANRWACFGTASVFRYRVQSEQADRSDAYASAAGLQWNGPHGVMIRGEAQYLRNAVMRNDVRVLLHVEKAFAFQPQEGGR